ncbi:MAG: hypothetical protein HGA53_10235 [Anaerolineaceae bacterium]|nr:hypothetical protein [Anaerolineaceae bacterium]
MSKEAINQQIREMIANANRIVVVSHIRPDGDAVGSLLGLGNALIEAGKEVQLILQDGVPGSFRHLPSSDKVTRRITSEYDLAIVVDCSDMIRTGGVLGERQPDINIDHHITNLNFATINCVYPEAVATSVILANNLSDWGFKITPAVAKPLLTGLVSDTLGFRTANVTPGDLRVAANLMEDGATNLSDLYQRALNRRSFEGIRYWGQGLSKIQRQGKLVYTVLSISDRASAGYNGNDDADLINVIQNVEDSDIAMILVEQHGGKVKISWRAQPGIDVSALALSFGGGGHPAAAGCEISGNLEEVQAKVLKATLKVLENNHNGSTNGTQRNQH